MFLHNLQFLNLLVDNMFRSAPLYVVRADVHVYICHTQWPRNSTVYSRPPFPGTSHTEEGGEGNYDLREFKGFFFLIMYLLGGKAVEYGECVVTHGDGCDGCGMRTVGCPPEGPRGVV